MKYYMSQFSTNAYVWFKLLDQNGNILNDYKSAACFAQINYNGLSEKVAKIQIYRAKNMMPYRVPEIKRWIDDLNEMGFPCLFVNNEVGNAKKQEDFIKDTVKKNIRDMVLCVMCHGSYIIDSSSFYDFFIDLKDYKDKNHLFSTLSLIRCLSEQGLDQIPEVYFNKLDENPKLDKFQALQDAHKQHDYANGHVVTYKNNGNNITKEQLFKKFEEYPIKLSEKNRLSIHASWSA